MMQTGSRTLVVTDILQVVLMDASIFPRKMPGSFIVLFSMMSRSFVITNSILFCQTALINMFSIRRIFVFGKEDLIFKELKNACDVGKTFSGSFKRL